MQYAMQYMANAQKSLYKQKGSISILYDWTCANRISAVVAQLGNNPPMALFRQFYIPAIASLMKLSSSVLAAKVITCEWIA